MSSAARGLIGAARFGKGVGMVGGVVVGQRPFRIGTQRLCRLSHIWPLAQVVRSSGGSAAVDPAAGGTGVLSGE